MRWPGLDPWLGFVRRVVNHTPPFFGRHAARNFDTGTSKEKPTFLGCARRRVARLHDLANELGVTAGTLFTPIRVASTGRTQAPPLFSTLAALGRETVTRRLRMAVERLAQL